MSLKLLHQGSVKDIYQAAENELLFRFSNRYSIFDWGQMPDEIPEKGSALATMGDLLMRHLRDHGIKTHYIQRGELKEDLIVKAVSVPRDGVGIYQKNPNSILIPLEVIYRFGVPKGSSLIRKGFKEGEEFSPPRIDFTTKLERMDRALTPDEAKQMAGMSEDEWHSLLTMTQTIAQKLKNVFEVAGLKLWDGKLEFAFDSTRNIMLVDSIGLDEIRLTFEGHTLSKELLRQCYLTSKWYQALAIAKEKSPQHFKEYCVEELNESPAPLPASVIQAMGKIYQITSDLILNSNRNDVLRLQQDLSQQLLILKEVP